jgi:hypothetical protein
MKSSLIIQLVDLQRWANFWGYVIWSQTWYDNYESARMDLYESWKTVCAQDVNLSKKNLGGGGQKRLILWQDQTKKKHILKYITITYGK